MRSKYRATNELRGELERDHPRRFFRSLRGSRFLITAAQNATPIHPQFWAALQVAAKHLRATIVVIPLRYKNPTSVWSASQANEEWWDAPLEKYLFNVRKKLCRHLVIAADVKTQPTATEPLSGFEGLTGAESCIIGHTKMQFASVAVPPGHHPKILSTTGAVTKPNFTDSKAGKLGAFHHFLGAVLVEIDGREFHLRQLNADRVDGSFIDLDKLYTVDGVRQAPPALGLNLGDTHAYFTDLKVDQATFGLRGIVETLDPKTIFFNDLLDGYSHNPHHVGNPFIARAKQIGNVGNVREEVEHAIRFVQRRIGKNRQAIIVASNHDDFLSRWILRTDWRQDVANGEFYLRTALEMLTSVEITPNGTKYADPFIYWVDKLKSNANIRCLAPNESFKLAGIECAMHGHLGPGGKKGTLKNMARLSVRVNTAHAHGPGIYEANYRVGTSTPRELEYTLGSPSNWMNTHCVIYANGKRALISITPAGRWRR